MKKLMKSIKKWDEKNTTMPSAFYMTLMLIAATLFLMNLNHAMAYIIYM